MCSRCQNRRTTTHLQLSPCRSPALAMKGKTVSFLVSTTPYFVMADRSPYDVCLCSHIVNARVNRPQHAGRAALLSSLSPCASSICQAEHGTSIIERHFRSRHASTIIEQQSASNVRPLPRPGWQGSTGSFPGKYSITAHMYIHTRFLRVSEVPRRSGSVDDDSRTRLHLGSVERPEGAHFASLIRTSEGAESQSGRT